MTVEKLMGGLAVKEIHPKLRLYLQCSPSLDLSMRFLPRDGGYYNQDYEDMLYFYIIERKVIEVMNRKAASQK